MNALKKWVKESREQQRRTPERYLAGHPDLWMDDTHVLMTQEKLDQLVRECGRYDGSLPTGAYLGKMFIQGNHLCWFSIDKTQPMTHYAIRARTIEVVDS